MASVLSRRPCRSLATAPRCSCSFACSFGHYRRFNLWFRRGLRCSAVVQLEGWVLGGLPSWSLNGSSTPVYSNYDLPVFASSGTDRSAILLFLLGVDLVASPRCTPPLVSRLGATGQLLRHVGSMARLPSSLYLAMGHLRSYLEIFFSGWRTWPTTKPLENGSTAGGGRHLLAPLGLSLG